MTLPFNSKQQKIMKKEKQRKKMSYKAKARVKVITEAGKWYLAEIKGLKEGTIVEGIYNPLNRAFDFYWNGEGAMLWIGENGELIDE
jgi:hypothetical protein